MKGKVNAELLFIFGLNVISNPLSIYAIKVYFSTLLAKIVILCAYFCASSHVHRW